MKLQAEIRITGTFDKSTPYSFRIYKQAFILRIKGHITFSSPNEMVIVAEGDTESLEIFIQLIQRIFSAGYEISCLYSTKNFINYQEFRI